MRTTRRKPSPALVVAMLALFITLGGVATAAAVVPLAKRALVADNAKKLGGRTLPQLNAQTAQAIATGAQAAASQPGPASTAAGLVVVKSQGASIPPESFIELGSLTCDSGQKVMGGGLSSNSAVITGDSYPANDTTWAFSALNLASATASVTLWITCLK